MHTHLKLTPFETNSRGLRDREYDLSKPENVFRVAVIGDLYTMPSGVDVRNPYHKVVERRLNLAGGPLSYEFINFDVGGYSLRQYWAVIRHKVLKYDPDMVLIGFCSSSD